MDCPKLSSTAEAVLDALREVSRLSARANTLRADIAAVEGPAMAVRPPTMDIIEYLEAEREELLIQVCDYIKEVY